MPVYLFAIGLLVGLGVALVLAVFVGRTQIRKAREAERRARAAERLAEVGAMTSGLAHEITTPLSTIGLNAKLLAESVHELDAPEDDRARIERRLDSLRRETERLSGILQDFLEFAGELRLQPAPCDLNALVEDLADFFLPQAERAGVRLRSQLAEGPLLASIDEPQVKQAVLNLMLNAVQAMQPGSGAAEDGAAGGELLIRTESRRSASGVREVVVHVADTGPGMEAETVGRIFEPYFTTKASGTGLGLPTTRRIVEALGGGL
ncbi:MAG: ATP-binding protein, partial [Planctomycetota bacterium]